MPKKSTQVTLGTRSIYVVPTRYGFIMAGMLFTLLLVGTNYNNSMTFLLTFLVTSICLIGMHLTFANMRGLCFSTTPTEPIFANESALFTFNLKSLNRSARESIYLGEVDSGQHPAFIEKGNDARIYYTTAPLKRGVYHLPRLQVWTKYPFGLFFAWGYLHLDAQVVVYPEPKNLRKLSQNHGDESGDTPTQKRGDDEHTGIRRYEATDSPQRIAWKAMARSQTMLSKEFSRTADGHTWLRYDGLLELTPEDRLSQLCQWILDCEEQGLAYGLVLPKQSVPIACGLVHKKQCLSLLAKYDMSGL